MLDYETSGFPSNPVTFAPLRFLRYPAITIGLYPRLFPLAEAVAFSLFGFSHAVGRATVTVSAAAGMGLTVRTALAAMATRDVTAPRDMNEVLRLSNRR